MEQCDIPDILAILSYLSQVYDTFRREIPHIKHPKLVFNVYTILMYSYFIVSSLIFINLFRKIVIMDQHQQKIVLKIILLKIIIFLQNRPHWQNLFHSRGNDLLLIMYLLLIKVLLLCRDVIESGVQISYIMEHW